MVNTISLLKHTTISFSNYIRRHFTLIWVIFLLLTTTLGLWDVFSKWQSVGGGEYWWIAQSLADGHSYSIDASHRWMFNDFESSYPSDKYFPTAISEPVYPTLMALSLKVFGEYGKLAILIFQVTALTLTSVVVYFLGRKVFNPQTGILAGSILAIWHNPRPIAEQHVNPAIFVGLMMCISAFLILWCLEKVSVPRGIVLGLVLGFTCLIHVATLLFIPIAVLLVLLSACPYRPVVWKTALSILLTACVVVSPWTIRNLSVFGEFVPVRTGTGLNTHQGNPILAGTFSPGDHACSNTLGPLWKAENAREAIRLSRWDLEKTRAIYKRSYECIEQKAPQNYENFNEAQRDKFYLKNTLEFVFSAPQTFATLAYYKFIAFFSGWGRSQGLVGLLAFAGALISFRNQQARVLTLLALTFSIPYVIAVQWFYRYRYPIEPVLLILASYVVIFAASLFWRAKRKKYQF
jgi:4-amino-4-deoxy-L-arabinose transferase-like glycosyltransferase